MGKRIRKTVSETPLQVWLKGLAAAAIGGAAGGATEVIEKSLQHGSVNWSEVGTHALTGAVILTIGYLVRSPLFQPPTNPSS